MRPDSASPKIAAPSRSGIGLRTDHLDGGHHVEQIISAEEVGLCVEEKAIEARADRPHRIQEWPHSEGSFEIVLQAPDHEGLRSDSPIDALPSRVRLPLAVAPFGR
jgi:hypothetical protein